MALATRLSGGFRRDPTTVMMTAMSRRRIKLSLHIPSDGVGIEAFARPIDGLTGRVVLHAVSRGPIGRLDRWLLWGRTSLRWRLRLFVWEAVVSFLWAMASKMTTCSTFETSDRESIVCYLVVICKAPEATAKRSGGDIARFALHLVGVVIKVMECASRISPKPGTPPVARLHLVPITLSIENILAANALIAIGQLPTTRCIG